MKSVLEIFWKTFVYRPTNITYFHMQFISLPQIALATSERTLTLFSRLYKLFSIASVYGENTTVDYIVTN